jgi:hypothetical protein
MNGPRIVATATFLLLLPQSNNADATANGPVLQRQPLSDADELL